MPEMPVTVITGAGSGLGRALAVRLAGTGHRAVLVGRRKERLADTQRCCAQAGAGPDGTVVLAADLTAPDAARTVVATALDAFGRLDALVNNAAQARFAPLEAATDQDLTQLTALHLAAPVALTRAALPALRASRGMVVNVGSIGGLLAVPGRALYGASKAALHHLTRSLAKELAPEVRVNAVLPGAIDTEMYDHTGLTPDAAAELRAEMIATTPLGRMGRPDDVVPWIEMLLGPAGRWMTGSLLVVDGGRAC